MSESHEIIVLDDSESEDETWTDDAVVFENDVKDVVTVSSGMRNGAFNTSVNPGSGPSVAAEQTENQFVGINDSEEQCIKKIIHLFEESPDLTDEGITNVVDGVCCNAWCSNPASVVPLENHREYYRIPKGNMYKICKECLQCYHDCLGKAVKNLESGGNILDGQCKEINNFIVLDMIEEEEVEQSDEVKQSDPGMEKLIEQAVKQSIDDLNKKYNFSEMITNTNLHIANRLEKLVEEGNRVAEKISEMTAGLHECAEEFKKAFACENTVVTSVLDIPIEESDNLEAMGDESSISITGDEHLTDMKPNESSSSLSVEESSSSLSVDESSLPPFGETVKLSPLVGEVVYAVKGEELSEWIPFKITKITYDCCTGGVFTDVFHLSSVCNNGIVKRKLKGDHVAFSSVPSFRVPFASRVIGSCSQNHKSDSTKSFFSGMIAELPTIMNNFRYLLFFDDGKAQYCSHNEIRVVYKTFKKIHEYFVGFHSNFIQQYLKTFPERPMVKTKTEHFVRVELNGFWISGKVDKLDGSLARVTFLNDNHSEWIYRGSPRLRPVYERLQANLRRHEGQAPPVPQLQKPSQAQSQKPAIQIVIDSSDDEDNNTPPQQTPVRAVARKSTARAVHVPQSVVHPPKRSLEKRVTRSCIVRKLPIGMLNPNTFHYHKCSRACVAWVRYSDEKTQYVNPLAIPSIFAFRREIDMSSAVTYTAPCGKRLKNIQEVLKYLSETLIPLTLDMFDFDIRTQIFDEYVVASQFVIIDDISYGAERNPVACVNELDSDCPDLMQYMIERRPLEGVDINLDPDFLVCCDCVDNCRDRSKCRCWRLTIDSFKPFNHGEDKRHITKIGYQYQRLDQNVLSGIYECNSRCHCNTVTCINRVVQHQTRHKLQLFKTHKKGWGTRCLNDIPQGVFICTYVGNILTEPSANETGTVNGDEYFAELDHIEVMEEHKADFEAEALKMTDEEEDESEEETQTREVSSSGRALRSSTCKKRRYNSQSNTSSSNGPRNPTTSKASPVVVENSEDEDDDENSVRKYYGPNETVYVMDAKIAGNIGRYFNHSCDPNIFVQNVYVDTHDLRFPWVAFFAQRHIPAGTELTWDYGYKIGSVPGKVLYCYCGAQNCRKRLL